MRALAIVPSALHHAIVLPLRMMPLWMRQIARRPTNSEASRFVTWACSGMPAMYFGAGIVSTSRSSSGLRFSPGWSMSSVAVPALALV